MSTDDNTINALHTSPQMRKYSTSLAKIRPCLVQTNPQFIATPVARDWAYRIRFILVSLSLSVFAENNDRYKKTIIHCLIVLDCATLKYIHIFLVVIKWIKMIDTNAILSICLKCEIRIRINGKWIATSEEIEDTTDRSHPKALTLPQSLGCMWPIYDYSIYRPLSRLVENLVTPGSLLAREAVLIHSGLLKKIKCFISIYESLSVVTDQFST